MPQVRVAKSLFAQSVVVLPFVLVRMHTKTYKQCNTKNGKQSWFPTVFYFRAPNPFLTKGFEFFFKGQPYPIPYFVIKNMITRSKKIYCQKNFFSKKTIFGGLFQTQGVTSLMRSLQVFTL